jgi:hypothetical protein
MEPAGRCPYCRRRRLAIAVGDALFYTDALTNLSHLNKDSATGYFFGYAMAANAGAGTATTISVLHVPGGGVLAALGVGAAQLASDSVTTVKILANNVTAAKVTATMRTGIIHLPLLNWVISAGALGNIAANTGIMASDSTPTLTRVNGATDPTMVITWVANGILAVTCGSIISPPDLDGTQPVNFNMFAAMGGGTDHPTSTLGMFEGVGGATIGGAMPAMAGGTTPAVYTKACTVTATAAAPKPWSFIFTPAAHANDTLLVYATWLSYTRL